jgi:hypothetical protein
MIYSVRVENGHRPKNKIFLHKISEYPFSDALLFIMIENMQLTPLFKE